MTDYHPTQTSSFPFKEKLLNRIWSFVNRSLFRYSPFFLRKYRVFLVRLFGAKVDWTCSLDNRCLINHPQNLRMGAFSSLASGSYVSCADLVYIGKFVCVGRDVNILSGSHNIHSPDFELITKPVIIEDNVWIATDAIVLPGISLSKNTVVAAGAVVVSSTEKNDVIGGNPARFLKKRRI